MLRVLVNKDADSSLLQTRSSTHQRTTLHRVIPIQHPLRRSAPPRGDTHPHFLKARPRHLRHCTRPASSSSSSSTSSPRCRHLAPRSGKHPTITVAHSKHGGGALALSRDVGGPLVERVGGAGPFVPVPLHLTQQIPFTHQCQTELLRQPSHARHVIQRLAFCGGGGGGGVLFFARRGQVQWHPPRMVRRVELVDDACGQR